MLKSCWTSVTSAAGSSPACASPAKTSYSLPNPQLPTVLPAKSAGVVMPESANDTWSVPERWNTCAMSMMSAPASRVASAFGTHATAKSTAPSASGCCGTMSTPPSISSTSRHWSA